MNSIRILLNAAIDYAGLFPPAGLKMADAVCKYASARGGEASWAIGRFVIPVSRLAEFEDASAGLLPRSPAEMCWRLSALGGSDRNADIERIISFNQRHSASLDFGVALIDTIELQVQSAQEIHQAVGITPRRFETYFEVPLFEDTPALIATVARTGGRAKVRTGGLTPELFPSPGELARFIHLCAQAAVPFKATAGLHHPFRSIHRLKYNSTSPSAMMHGFLNVFLAAAFAHAGMAAGTAEKVLEEESIQAFGFDDDGVSWNTNRLTNNQLLDARQQFAISFGSCSIQEPMDDLKALNLL